MEKFIEFPGPVVFQKIELLQEGLPALWGTMTAWHMMEHLMLPLQFSRGEFDVPLVTPAEKVEKVKRIMLMSDAPLKRDFAAPFIGEGLQPLKYASFEESKMKLLEEVNRYLLFWEENERAIFVHPIFGPLNKAEWLIFHRKHFTHHLSQFGLL
jgi:hypothetical protein